MFGSRQTEQSLRILKISSEQWLKRYLVEFVTTSSAKEKCSYEFVLIMQAHEYTHVHE